MRNLKKILALVLALVMSLSLMATAGAADFPDVKDDTSFKTAIDVLSGLGVFNGYKEDGTFRPDGEITRAETAAIIYRIVTGDVKDEQVGIYADYGLFKDVPATSWYAGYVNFCANAEYIKGDGNGKFSPNDKVEGYAALAMILRAIGYTANGGFTGSDWRVQTARVGEARKITKNITTGTLGANADRKTVAEILYQAIMVNMVDHNVDYTFNGEQGYFETNETLGQKTFGLEYVSGVILANEWANLDVNGDEVLAEGKTRMEITDIFTGSNPDTKYTLKIGDKLTLDAVAEEDMQGALDAVGLTYNAHIATKRSNLVASLDKSDVNVVAYNEGKGVYTTANNNNLNNYTWTNVQKLADEENITLGSTVVGAEHETEYFVNYEQWWDIDYKSDIIIRYTLDSKVLKLAVDLGYIGPSTAQSYIDYLNDLANITSTKTHSPQTVTVTGNPLVDGKKYVPVLGDETTWIRTIQPGQLITKTDRAIMKDIFDTASALVNGAKVFELGEVYAGTSQKDDLSDTMSWVAFCEKYFIVDENTKKFDTCQIGNSLRVIDNNDDGYAEYVLRIDYTQDKAIGTVKDLPAGYSVALAGADYLYNPQADEITTGTVFNYTTIDKKLYVWPAPVVSNETITNKNFQNITVTASNGETYNQSGIENMTRLDENIMLMAQNTPYNMYMDVYGVNIRSYELAQGGKYALLTEMYPTGNQNSNYVQNWQAVAEVKIQDADVKEYAVAGNDVNRNLFYNPSVWTWGNRTYNGVDANVMVGTTPSAYNYNANYLQPAVAHLGITGSNLPKGTPAVWTGSTTNTVASAQTIVAGSGIWNNTWWRWVAQANTNANPAGKGYGSEYGVFNYGTGYNPDKQNPNATFSFTNVATYINNDDTLTLGSASKLSKDRATGAQLYRITGDYGTPLYGPSKEALTGVTATTANAAARDQLKGWAIGTEKQLVDAYNVLHTTGGQAWFDKWVGTAYQNGNGIYPVYAEDYVHLDLTLRDDGKAPIGEIAVKAGTRHYHINDTYSANYNTNGNSYVDATVDTEFYIVLPGNETSIEYYKGFANLPTIETSKIRAAYAVAHNTAEQSDGQDYWVADVIVIELSELTYDYDSISLVYYNPYEQNSYVRYADTLNNEWKNLQPDYDKNAMMGITPQAGFSNINWGNSSWSTINNEANYKFWKLFRTELTQPGQLAVTSAEAVESGKYNKYGIYAGAINRIEDLQTSDYVDVTAVNTGSGFTHLIDVDYGEVSEVPFYRITSSTAAYGTIYTAVQLNDNRTLQWSDVKNGDELIWVYNKAQNRIAFVVDLGSRTPAEMGNSTGYTAPTWLWNLYEDVRDNGTTAAAPDTKYAYNVNVKQVGPNGEDLGTKVYGTNTSNGSVTFNANDLAITGYTLGKVFDENSVLQNPTSVGGTDTWVVPVNGKVNQEWIAYYSAVQPQLTLAVPTGTPNANLNNTNMLTTWKDGAWAGTTYSAPVVYAYNDEFQIRFTGTAGQQYVASRTAGSAADVTLNNGGKAVEQTIGGTKYMVISGTIRGNVTLEIVESAIPVPTTYTVTANANNATTGLNNTDVTNADGTTLTTPVNAGSDIKFRVDTGSLNNTMSGITVAYSVVGGVTNKPVAPDLSGVYTISGTDVIGNVTITVTGVPKPAASYAVSFTMATGLNAQTCATNSANAADWTAASNTPSPVNVVPTTGEVYVKTSAAAQLTVSPANATITAVDATNTLFKVSNVTGAVTITAKVAPRNPGLASIVTSVNTSDPGMGSLIGAEGIINSFSVSGNTVTLNVSVNFPAGSTYNPTANANMAFPGFGADWADMVAKNHAHNPTGFPANPTAVGFYGLQVPNAAGNGYEDVVIAVGTPSNGNPKDVTVGTITYKINATVTFG